MITFIIIIACHHVRLCVGFLLMSEDCYDWPRGETRLLRLGCQLGLCNSQETRFFADTTLSHSRFRYLICSRDHALLLVDRAMHLQLCNTNISKKVKMLVTTL